MTGPRFSLSAGFSPWQSIQTRSFCKQYSLQLDSNLLLLLIKRQSDWKDFYMWVKLLHLHIFPCPPHCSSWCPRRCALGCCLASTWRQGPPAPSRWSCWAWGGCTGGHPWSRNGFSWCSFPRDVQCADQWKIVTSKDNELPWTTLRAQLCKYSSFPARWWQTRHSFPGEP